MPPHERRFSNERRGIFANYLASCTACPILRISAPATPATRKPVMMPRLAAPTKPGSRNANMATNNDMVKPIPARHPYKQRFPVHSPRKFCNARFHRDHRAIELVQQRTRFLGKFRRVDARMCRNREGEGTACNRRVYARAMDKIPQHHPAK